MWLDGHQQHLLLVWVVMVLTDLSKVHLLEEEEPNCIWSIGLYQRYRVQHIAQGLAHLQSIL